MIRRAAKRAGAMAVIMACVAEVASQFAEHGGAYLYTRTAFGRFVGMQIGWFFLLAVVGAVSVAANLFVDYLIPFLPWTISAWKRPLVVALLIAIPTATNYCGVRSGANLSNVMTVAKLLPLALLILFGMAHFIHEPQLIHASDIVTPSWSNWVRAIALLMFPFSGWEESLSLTGEVKDPRRTIPLALAAGLITAAAVYTLLQFIIVTTVGPNASEQAIAQTASALLGGNGEKLVAIAIMLATYGYISANLLNDSRLVYSLAAQGDFPNIFAKIHSRFHTPAVAIVVYASTAWLLAVVGTFQFVLALAAGATVIYYGGMCASLIRLRRLRPAADAFRIPFGPALSIVAIALSLTLLTGVKRDEFFMMCVTALIAAANWVWVRRYHSKSLSDTSATVASLPPPDAV
jgi:basic amino acid/polyamine antiporter, APA family